MNAMLDAALAWLLWTGLWWGALALGIALWFRLRPPQTTPVRHAAVAAAILAGTLSGLLPKWGHGVVTAPVTAAAQPSAPAPTVDVGVVRDTLPAPHDSALAEERAGNLVPSTPIVVPINDVEPLAIPAARDWLALGKYMAAAAWVLGALLLSVRLVLAVRMTVRWRREAQPLPEGERAIFAALRQELRVRRATQAGSHEEPASPLVLCGWPPLVLVPSDWPLWDESSRCAAWRHELAHVRRRDDWWRILSETLRVLWWFHPGVRWLLTRREHEAELLSDEAAVAAGCPPQELAQVLLDACRRPLSAAWPSPAGTFYSPRTMKLRIARLLDAPSAEALCRPAPRGLRFAAIAGMALLALVGSMRWIAAANEANDPPPVDGTSFTVTAGGTTTLDKSRGKGAAVHGKVTMPATHRFVRQEGEAQRKLDWSLPTYSDVSIWRDGQRYPLEIAEIRADGSFQFNSHLPPGKYRARASAQLPYADRGGFGPGTPKQMPDWSSASINFVIPEPPNDLVGPPPVRLELAMPTNNPRFVAAAVAALLGKPVDPPKQEPPPIKDPPNYVKVVGQLLDADTGQPIEKASWEWGMADPKHPTEIAWGHAKKLGGDYPKGKFEELVHFTPDGQFDRLRVYAAGYETKIVVDELPKPRPLQVERIVRMKRGRTVTGTLRDHTGKPVASGWVFFIPAGHRSNIVEGVPGTDAYKLPSEPRDAAVSEARTNSQGQFVLPAGSAGTLAASTDAVDLWPFPLPDDGHADLTMPQPAHLAIDLTYWYLDNLANKGKRAYSPDSEDPNQCWIQVDRPGELNGPWKGLEYRRQMFVFALDPSAKLSKGVSVDQVLEGEWDQPIPGVGHNKNTTTKIRIALPPGNYRVQRLRAGPFAPVDERNVELKPGVETTIHWARGDGAAVRGKLEWPVNMMFVRQAGAAPRKLDWSVPDLATVTIADAEGKPIEAAKIQADGSFFVATHLDPGKYKVTATVYLPERDFRGGYRIADVVATQELVIPDPLRRPSGSPPVNVAMALRADGPRFVPAEAPAADPSKQ